MWPLTDRDDPQRAWDVLAGFVRAVSRQKRHQTLVEHAGTAVFWALLISIAAVLSIRLGGLAYSPIGVVASLLVLAVIVSAFMTWWRRLDDLETVVLADLELNLKQRFSTAWEFARLEPDSPLTGQLVRDAVRNLRLPRYALVFPRRLNTLGKLTPLAAALLVLVSIVDLQRVSEVSPPVADQLVVDQGAQLREFARHMQRRAEREALPRSVAEAERLHRLGARMQSGTLSRGQAIGRLRQLGTTLDEQRQLALSEVGESTLDPLQTGSQTASGALKRVRLRSKRLLSGQRVPGDIETLSVEAATLARLGVSTEQLEEALASFAEGDDRNLRDMLENLSGIEQSLLDAEALGRAEEKVARVRENLGDIFAGGERQTASSEGALRGQTNAFDGAGGPGGHAGDEAGAGYSSEAMGGGRKLTRGSQSARAQVTLKPESQFGAGGVFIGEIRVLPRSGQSSVEVVELEAQFAAQVEAVLAKEQYPVHTKEFIRRYFLSLSAGETDEGG